MPVHHVHVHPVGAALEGGGHLLGEPAQVGAQHAGSDAYGHAAVPFMMR